MGAFDPPGRLFQFGRRKGYRVQWGNPYTNALAFLFVPTPDGFLDLVRGDRARLGGSYTVLTNTPIGTGWWLGNSASGLSGYAETAGNNPYYNHAQALGSATQINTSLSIMCGCYNPATLSTASQRMLQVTQTPISDSAGAVVTRAVDQAGTMKSSTFAGGGGTTADQQTSVSSGLLTAGLGIVKGGGRNLTGSNNLQDFCWTVAYASGATGSGGPVSSNASTGSEVPVNLSKVVLSSTDGNTEYCDRVVLWAAGWFTNLSATQMQAIASYNGAPVGALPPCLAVRSRTGAL